MKLLIVSYFFAPSPTVAAERWTRFRRYLEKNNQVSVLAGPWKKEKESGITYLSDPFSEDAAAFAGNLPVHQKKKSGFLSKNLKYLLIDGKFIWSFKVAFRILLGEKQDLVLVSGTPWSSVCLVALACSVKGQKYAVDFRDFWANEPFATFDDAKAKKYYAALEGRVLKKASGFITVNEVLLQYFSRHNAKIPALAVPNAFDGSLDFTSSDFNSVLEKKHEILYAGSISARSGVGDFLKLAGQVKDGPAIAFMGTDHEQVFAKEPEKLLPSRSLPEAENEMKLSAVLLLTLDRNAKNYTTGKLLSYLKAGRPILYYGPVESPAAKMVLDLKVGWVIANGDLIKLQAVLNEIYVHCKNKKPFAFEPSIEAIKYFSLDSIGARLDACLKTMVKATSSVP